MKEQSRSGSPNGEPAAYRPDSIDRQIITLLLKDGRTSAAALAKVVGASPRAVRYRIERLLGCGVIRIGAVVDPRAVGLELIADVFLEVAPGQIREVAERLAALPEVSFVAAAIGNGDLSIQVCLRDSAALTQFIEELVGQVPGVMRARTVLVPWKLKDVHQWNIPPSALNEKERDVQQTNSRRRG